MMLLSSTLTYSQPATQTDSLIYTPQYLFELMVADLEQCDLDRIELKKLKAEMSLIYVDLAKEQAAKSELRKQITELSLFNDSLTASNMMMAMENQRNVDKLKRQKRWWKFGTLMGAISAIGVHLNWKESWIEWGQKR